MNVHITLVRHVASAGGHYYQRELAQNVTEAFTSEKVQEANSLLDMPVGAEVNMESPLISFTCPRKWKMLS